MSKLSLAVQAEAARIAATPTGPRDIRDAKRLAELEKVIDRGLGSFVEVGEALLEVRDSRLYRIGYATFEDYCKGRWKLERRRAYQLMEASEVAGALASVNNFAQPANEAQARELSPVVREHGAEAAAQVMAEASADGSPTAAKIRAVVDEKWAPASGLMSSDSAEWYTPRHILDAVVATMGAIDLDPCAEPARSVPATTHYTEVDDGLAREWAGRVYMNPPYGRVIGAWVDHLADEYEAGSVTEAVALVPARTDTSWFAHLPWTMVCFVTGRLSFSDHENPAPFPSAACYLGPNGKRFAEVFLSLGIVTVRLEIGG